MNRTILRFLKYFSIGFSTFLFELLLLYVFTHFLLLNYFISAGAAYLIAISVNYYFSRKFVFSKTKRGVKHTYINFVLISGAGLVGIVGFMALFVEVFHANYLISRIIIGGIVGMWNYLMNLFVNFKVSGRH